MSTVFRTELKLLLRSWVVWVFLAVALLMSSDALAKASMATFTFWADESFLRFFLLGPLVLTSAAARRSATERVDELIGALPYRPAAWVLGRFLANYALWLAISLAGWVVLVASMAARGDLIDVRLVAVHWLVEAPISVGVVTAVGFALGSLPGSSLIAYICGLAYYFCGVTVPMLTEGMQRRPLTFLDYLAVQRWMPLTVSGYSVHTGLLLANRLFALGLASGLGALVLWLLARRRRLPVLMPLVALVLAVTTAVAAAAGSDYIYRERSRTVAAEAALRIGRKPVPPDASQALRADGYDLTAAVAPGRNELSVTGSFDVTNGGDRTLDRLELTLRASFQVESVLGPGGQAVPFQRDGDSLAVALPLAPGQTTRLTAHWSGQVLQWRSTMGQFYWGRSLYAHITDDSIFLPATYGWYPLPVRASLAQAVMHCEGKACAPEVTDLTIPVPSATFALTVTGTDLSLVSNAGERSAGLYLVGSRLPTVTEDGLALTVAPWNRSRAVAIIGKMRERAALLGQPFAPDRVIELPEGAEVGGERAADLRETPGAVVLRSSDFDELAGDEAPWRITARWLGAAQQTALARGVSRYVEWALAGGGPVPAGKDPDLMFMRVLVALEQARGRDTAIGVVQKALIAPSAGPSDAAFIQAVEQAAGGDPAVLTALEAVRRSYQ